MSNAVSGVIAKLNFRPINADESPNQWGKTHRVSIKVGDNFYGCGECKPSPQGQLQLRVQAGKDWVTINEGDEVQFFTKSREVNGKTYYDKDGQLKLVKAGNGQAAPSQPATAAKTGTSTGSSQPAAAASAPTASTRQASSGGGDAMQERIINGMLLNNAVAYAANIEIEPGKLEDAIVAYAAIFRRALSRIGIAAPAAGNAQPVTATGTSVSEPAPAANPAPANTASAPVSQSKVQFEDDDIPF